MAAIALLATLPRGDFVNCKNQKITGISTMAGIRNTWCRPPKASLPSPTTCPPRKPLRCFALHYRFNALRNSGPTPAIWSPSKASAASAISESNMHARWLPHLCHRPGKRQGSAGAKARRRSLYRHRRGRSSRGIAEIRRRARHSSHRSRCEIHVRPVQWPIQQRQVRRRGRQHGSNHSRSHSAH